MDVLRKGRLVKQKLLFDYLHSSTNSSNSVLPFTTGWDKIWAVLWGICVNFCSRDTTISFMSCEISKVFSGLKHHKAIWKNRYYLIYLKSYLTRYLYKLEFIASFFKAVLDWLKFLAFYIKLHMPIKNSFPKWGPISSKGLTKLVFLFILFSHLRSLHYATIFAKIFFVESYYLLTSIKDLWLQEVLASQYMLQWFYSGKNHL